MKKFFSNFIIIIYAIFAIFVTICLMSYNDYKVTEFGNYTLIIVDSNEIKGDFEKGSLVVVDTDEEPEIGEKAFFYNTSNKNEISLAEVKNKEKISEIETTYTFEGDKLVSTLHMIGTPEHSVVIPYVGTILNIVSSKWGYLFLVVLPTLLAFLYEIMRVIEEVKNGKASEEDDESDVKEKEIKEETNTEITVEKKVVSEGEVKNVKKEVVSKKEELKTEKIEEIKKEDDNDDDTTEENIELEAKIDELDDILNDIEEIDEKEPKKESKTEEN